LLKAQGAWTTKWLGLAPRPTAKVTRRKPRVSWGLGAVFLGPTLLLYFGLTIYPLFRTFYNSFFVLPTVNVEKFVGLENFRQVFAGDDVIWLAVQHSLIWSIGSSLLEIPIAFLLALALYARVPGERVFRLAWFAPMLLSYVVVGPIWLWIYDYDWGPIDVALRAVGLGRLAHPWLGNLTTALPALIVVTTWMFVGFNMVVFLAALHSLPAAVIEAAYIDGAGWWRTVRFIMVPLVWSTAAALTVLCVIGKMKQFALVYVMTKGGPLWSTETVATYIIKRAFQWKTVDLGYPSAVATLWFLATLIVTLVLIRLFHRRQQLEF
jgi:multiple sugar transport system permease protein/raffinose/stachyose/melibiose transport system permease protein